MDEVELRPVSAAEIGAVATLVRQAEAHDAVPRTLADEELAQELGAPHVDLAADTRVAIRHGVLVGWAYVWNPPAQHRLERAELYGEVAPAHRGIGVGRALAVQRPRPVDRIGAMARSTGAGPRANTRTQKTGRPTSLRRTGARPGSRLQLW